MLRVFLGADASLVTENGSTALHFLCKHNLYSNREKPPFLDHFKKEFGPLDQRNSNKFLSNFFSIFKRGPFQKDVPRELIEELQHNGLDVDARNSQSK